MAITDYKNVTKNKKNSDNYTMLQIYNIFRKY